VGLRPRLACSVDFASRWTLCKALVAFVCVYVEHITVGDLQVLASYVSLAIFYYHSQPEAIHFRSVPSVRRSDQATRRGGSSRGLKMLDAPAILVWRVSLVLLEFKGVETHLVDSEPDWRGVREEWSWAFRYSRT